MCTCRAAMAAAQPTGLPPKVLPCVPGEMHWRNGGAVLRLEMCCGYWHVGGGDLHDVPVAERSADRVHSAAQRLRPLVRKHT